MAAGRCDSICGANAGISSVISKLLNFLRSILQNKCAGTRGSVYDHSSFILRRVGTGAVLLLLPTGEGEILHMNILKCGYWYRDL